MADAKLIKELRDRTVAGFLDVKKALDASNDDINKAIEWLQERGQAKAAKKAGAIAAEGVVVTVSNDTHSVIYEVNTQTDFVATNSYFKDLVTKIGNALINGEFTNDEEANKVSINGKTISELTTEATATIGEKIELRRAQKIAKPENGALGAYTHGNRQVAAIVITEGGDNESARNVDMHVASMNPEFLDEAAIDPAKIEEMKAEIAKSPALEGKPENIKENIAKGMLRKQLSELTLVDQEFVMEKMPVSKYLSSKGAKAIGMIRYEVGEGIEKVETDFAAEVAAQMKG